MDLIAAPCIFLNPKIFREIFGKILKFSQVFRSFRTCSDLFRRVWMHSDAFGCVQMRSDAFGHFRKILNFFAKIRSKNTFSQFRQGFGGARGKRTSKSASASNFAQDTPILRSVRPKIAKKWLLPASASPIATRLSEPWCLYVGGGDAHLPNNI